MPEHPTGNIPSSVPPYYTEYLNERLSNMEKRMDEKFKNVFDRMDALAQLLVENREETRGDHKGCVDRCRTEMNEVYERLRKLENAQVIQGKMLETHLEEFEKMQQEKKENENTKKTEQSQWSQAYAGWVGGTVAVLALILTFYIAFFK